MAQKPVKPPETIWRPLTGMPDDAHAWPSGEYPELVAEWRRLKQEITDKKTGTTV